MAKTTGRRELERDEVVAVLATWTLRGAQAALEEWWGLVEETGGPPPTLRDLERLEASWEP